MTKYEDLKLKRNQEMQKAAEAAIAGDLTLMQFHSNAAVGFELKINASSVEDLEQEV